MSITTSPKTVKEEKLCGEPRGGTEYSEGGQAVKMKKDIKKINRLT
jgi:hypothetical protein